MLSCPVCTSSITLYSHNTTENTIRQALFGYWRWVAEGKPSPCVYYDHYHNHIEWLEEDRYYYHIQTFDSPEGDTWIRGTFRVQGVANIVIVEFVTEHM